MIRNNFYFIMDYALGLWPKPKRIFFFFFIFKGYGVSYWIKFVKSCARCSLTYSFKKKKKNEIMTYSVFFFPRLTTLRFNLHKIKLKNDHFFCNFVVFIYNLSVCHALRKT